MGEVFFRPTASLGGSSCQPGGGPIITSGSGAFEEPPLPFRDVFFSGSITITGGSAGLTRLSSTAAHSAGNFFLLAVSSSVSLGAATIGAPMAGVAAAAPSIVGGATARGESVS